VHGKAFFPGQALAALLAVAAAGAVAAEPPPEALAPRPIDSIDFYGLRSLDAETLRKALPMHEGDKVAIDESGAIEQKVKTVLSAWPHVRGSRVAFTCCAPQGGVNLFVGVEEDSAPVMHFRPPPAGVARLPDELVSLYGALDQALFAAIEKGRGREDDSRGYALQVDAPAAMALQEQSVGLAARNLSSLRQVLRESADGRQRAMAAQFLGYAPDQQAVVDDLVYAAGDPYEAVRNNAVRALLVFSRAERPPRVPYEPFVALLDSPVWTDLNKGSGALDALSRSRDPELLALLKRRSLPVLATIARWRSKGHAQSAYMILGRIAGYPDADLLSRWAKGDIEPVIGAALESGPNASGPR
jgi:hypothetical protein